MHIAIIHSYIAIATCIHSLQKYEPQLRLYSDFSRVHHSVVLSTGAYSIDHPTKGNSVFCHHGNTIVC